MQLTTDDVVVYLYTIGVALSSAWVVQTLLVGNRLVLVATSGVLALGWTVYFWISIAPRIHIERGAKPDEEEERSRT